MLGVGGRLQLKRRVFDPVPVVQQVLQVVQDRGAAAPGERVGGHGDVARHGDEAARDRPHMHVMQRGHARHCEHVGLHLLQVQLAWGVLHQDTERLAQQQHGPRDHEQRDGHRHHDIGAVEAGEQDHEPGQDDTQRAERVRQHLQIGAFDGQRLTTAPFEHGQRDPVDDHAVQRGSDHDSRFHRFGALPALDRFEQDVGRQAKQEQTVGDRRDDLDAVQAVGAVGLGGLGRHRDGRHRQSDPGDIGEGVGGISQQRQGVRPCGAQDLDDHDRQTQEQGTDQLRAVLHARGVAVARSHRMPPVLPASIAAPAGVQPPERNNWSSWLAWADPASATGGGGWADSPGRTTTNCPITPMSSCSSRWQWNM